MSNKNDITNRIIKGLQNFFQKKRINCIAHDNKLEFFEYNVTLSLDMIDIKNKENSIITTEKYIVSCPEFDRDFVDIMSNNGSTPDDIAKHAVKTVAYGILAPIFSYLYFDLDSTEVSTYGDTTHNWNVYAGKTLQTKNLPELEDNNKYWNAIKEYVLKYLGNQKNCLVKLVIYDSGKGSYSGECRINNEFAPEASKALEEFAKQWHATSRTLAKQYLLLTQDKTTFKAYPYKKEKIQDYVIDALKTLEDNNYEINDSYINKINDLIPDKNLAWEITKFLPEICTSKEYREYLDGPNMMLMQGSKQNYTCEELQITSYPMIRSGLNKAFKTNTLKDINKVKEALIQNSILAKIISNSIKSAKDSKQHDSISSCISFELPDNYEFR